jgi:hypothetical protein
MTMPCGPPKSGKNARHSYCTPLSSANNHGMTIRIFRSDAAFCHAVTIARICSSTVINLVSKIVRQLHLVAGREWTYEPAAPDQPDQQPNRDLQTVDPCLDVHDRWGGSWRCSVGCERWASVLAQACRWREQTKVQARRRYKAMSSPSRGRSSLARVG